MVLKEGREPFNPILALDSLRNQGFDEISAIGEIIDNSIDAKAKEIHVLFEWTDKPGKRAKRASRFIFTDNGIGMDKRILYDCLVIGESVSRYNPRGIGRFGVGGTFAGISQCRRIQAYSRPKGAKDWLYTYLDLDLLKEGKGIPEPKKAEIPKEYQKYMKDHGTMIIWDKADKSDFHEGERQNLIDWIARTYRKFICDEIIENGKPVKNSSQIKIFVEDILVSSQDPLYATKNPRFPNDERAKVVERKIPVKEIIEQPVKGEIIIRMSYLPEEWWKKEHSGGTNFARERKIDDNEGFSIVREDREVHYGEIPRFQINGDPGGEKHIDDLDRWWGCEICFTKEADDLFGIQNNKSRVTLSDEMLTYLIHDLSPAIVDFRKKFRSTREKYKKEQVANGDGHQKGVEFVVNSGVIKKQEVKASKMVELKNMAEKYAHTKAEQAEILKKLTNSPFVVFEDYDLDPQGPFVNFEYDYGNLILKYNMNHPFISKLYKFLEDSSEIENKSEEKKPRMNGQDDEVKDRIEMVKAFMDVLLAAFGQSRTRFPDLNAKEEVQETINTLVVNWGDIASKISRKARSSGE